MVMSPTSQDCDAPTLSSISYEFAIFVLPHPPDAPLPVRCGIRSSSHGWKGIPVNRLRDEDAWQCSRQPIILIEPRSVAVSERVHFSVPIRDGPHRASLKFLFHVIDVSSRRRLDREVGAPEDFSFLEPTIDVFEFVRF